VSPPSDAYTQQPVDYKPKAGSRDAASTVLTVDAEVAGAPIMHCDASGRRTGVTEHRNTKRGQLATLGLQHPARVRGWLARSSSREVSCGLAVGRAGGWFGIA
jgi:hypothetical protein